MSHLSSSGINSQSSGDPTQRAVDTPLKKSGSLNMAIMVTTQPTGESANEIASIANEVLSGITIQAEYKLAPWLGGLVPNLEELAIAFLGGGVHKKISGWKYKNIP